ncbi:MAG TPA: hypothetical protein VLA92_04570 [Candidatus Saccharimonadales bacterium]|nr:hypothetical protein [Candidatus Saccharimonadales bacterium]
MAFFIFASTLFGAMFVIQQEVQAAGCGGTKLWFNRAAFCGYFKNQYDLYGTDVRVGGIPASVNTVTEFENMIIGDLNSGNARRRTGGLFVIYTMIGLPAGSDQTPTTAQLNGYIAEWRERLRSYANTSENGAMSYGTNGSIDWSVWRHWPCGTKNTLYQDNRNDVAPYKMSSTNSDCERSSVMDDNIYIRDTDGNTIYVIRRACMNPIGAIGPLDDAPQPNYNLRPTVNVSINGGAAGAVAEEGDTIQFTYVVVNSGTTPSVNTACNTYRQNYPRYQDANPNPLGPDPGDTAGPSPGCPRNFAVGSTTVVTESVTAAANTTYCRKLIVNPYRLNGTARGKEVCVVVANQPYLKVFGGDVSVGNGQPTACTTNADAAISTWNKRAATYAGAGAQYAAYAMSTIGDFATAQNLTGGAPEPTGLSFANTASDVANGDFGGSLSSVPCIADYYGDRPGSTTALPANVSSMSGNTIYGATGNVTLTGGNINPGQKTSVYIDGDLYITSDITYAGNWSAGNIPLFEMVVRGNIYISSNVHRLDGVYVAQGGTIYTCATGFAAINIDDGAFFNTCHSKLTVNGAFVADSIEFLRTAASLGRSAANETSTAAGVGTNAAEVFNFNPSVWMVQPVDNGEGAVDNYDAITSLPPVL